MDLRDFDWSAQRTWTFDEGQQWYCKHNVETLRSSAYLYGKVSGFRVYSYFKKNGSKRRLTICFYGKRKEDK
jgi:hypothetical protein